MPYKPPETAEIYAKDEKLKQEDITTISQWLETQPHLPELTELQIMLFLHSCYYEIEPAKKTIDNYFTTRTLHPYIFECATRDAIAHFAQVTFVKILPRLTKEGYMVLTLKLLDTKASNFICVEVVKVAVMIATLHLHQKGPSNNGLLLLMDMEGASFAHLFKVNVMVIKRALSFFQEAAPVRIQGIHIINPVSITEKLMALLKPFMKEHLLKLLKFHKDMASLYQYVPKYCLPQDYGGEDCSMASLHDETIRNLYDNLDFFKWHDLQKVDETKRKNKNQRL